MEHRRRRGRKPRRCPETLWRIYSRKVRTLHDTLLSLLPPPNNNNGGDNKQNISKNGKRKRKEISEKHCKCKGRRYGGCLGCCDSPSAFLLRQNDSTEYRQLLTRSFAFLPEDLSTPFKVFDPKNDRKLIHIIRNTIEMAVITSQRSRSNVLCFGYDKQSRSSGILNALNTCSWEVLLRRIGDRFMVHLLQFACIFLAMPGNNYIQVAGCPIYDTACCLKSFPDCVSGSLASLRSFPCVTSGSLVHNRVNDVSEKYYTKKQEEESKEKQTFVGIGDDKRLMEQDWKKRLRPFSCQCRRKKRKKGPNGTKFTNQGEREVESESSCCTVVPGSVGSSSSLSSENRMQMQHDISTLTDSSAEQPSLFYVKKPCLQLDKQCGLLFISGTTEINHRQILYDSHLCSSVLPSNHVLLRTKALQSSLQFLLSDIYGTLEPSKVFDNGDRTLAICSNYGLLRVFIRLLVNIKRCQFGRLLNRHCPLPPRSYIRKMSPENLQKLSLTSNQSIVLEKQKVLSYIWSILRRVVPIPLLGGRSNLRNLRRNIACFINLRGYEKFYLSLGMRNLKLSGFSCFSEVTGRDSLQKVVELWVFWLFSHFIGPAIRAHFYVTESQNGRYDLFYYRKSVWRKITKKSLDLLCRKKVLSVPSQESQQKQCRIYPKVRFLPKLRGTRLIVRNRLSYLSSQQYPIRRSSMMEKSTGKQMVSSDRKKSRSSPSEMPILYDTFAVLKKIQMDSPEKLGFSVFGYNDVYKKLCPFLRSLKEMFGKVPELFLVVCDVTEAFDSINHQKLFHSLEDILDPVYHLKKFVKVRSNKNFMTSWFDKAAFDKNNDAEALFAACKGSSSCVLVDQASVSEIERKKLMDFLREHIEMRVYKVDDRFYQPKMGISQGSKLSCILCSMYYGHLEKVVILPVLINSLLAKSQNMGGITQISELALDTTKYTTNQKYFDERNTGSSLQKSMVDGLQTSLASCKPCSGISSFPELLVLRVIDDFMLISSSKELATDFVQLMHQGFEDYNCYTNKSKSFLNFDLQPKDRISSTRTYVFGDGNSFVPWNGLLINCRTFEVQADYTRYWNRHLNSTINIWSKSKLGHHLQVKLCRYILTKCHPLFYDLNINSPAIVRLNIYQSCVLCAMKFHCYFRSIDRINTFSANYLEKMIVNSIKRLCGSIIKSMHKLAQENNLRGTLRLDKKEVMYLGLTAFIRALQRKQSRYTELLQLLRASVKGCGCLGLSKDLKYAIDDSHSSMLWKIKY